MCGDNFAAEALQLTSPNFLRQAALNAFLGIILAQRTSLSARKAKMQSIAEASEGPACKVAISFASAVKFTWVMREITKP